jgi:hypothetical protein
MGNGIKRTRPKVLWAFESDELQQMFVVHSADLLTRHVHSANANSITRVQAFAEEVDRQQNIRNGCKIKRRKLHQRGLSICR